MKSKTKFKNTIFYGILMSISLLLCEGMIYAILNIFTQNEGLLYTFTYLILIILFIFIYHKTLIDDLKNLKKDVKGKIKHLTLMFVIFFTLMMLSNLILYNFFGNIASNENATRLMLKESPVIMFITLSILGPIAEEFMFRFPYRNVLTNRTITFFVYTLIFASTHIILETSLTGLFFLIPYLFLSSSFGYSFYKTNNIYTSMIFHIINNIIAVTTVLIGG